MMVMTMVLQKSFPLLPVVALVRMPRVETPQRHEMTLVLVLTTTTTPKEQTPKEEQDPMTQQKEQTPKELIS